LHPVIGKSTWPKLTLSTLAEEVRNLVEPKLDEALPYIGLEHIDQGGLSFSGIGTSADTQSTKKRFRKGDILFGTLRPYFRKVARANFDGVCSTDIAVIRAKEKRDRDFLFYFIANPRFIEYATTSSSGTRMPRAKWSHLASITWNLPGKEARKKIGDILSAYDDLIENNLRRIKILEEMAQLIYREWFVKFRFPGHEKVKMVDSPVGKIPEGWEMKELSSVTKIVDCLHSKKPTEATDPSEKYGILLHIWNIPGNGQLDLNKRFFINKDDYDNWTRNIEIMEGDCVITNVGRIGDFAQIPVDVKAAIGRNMTAVRPLKKGLSPTYLIEYLRSPHMDRERTAKTDRGTIMDSLNVKGIITLLVPVPPADLMTRFEATARPVRHQLEVLIQKNSNLRQTRDLLLPKLISGDLDVSDLDIKVREDLG